jgi:anti-sigma regulatory factor (Ser/Thr protein kinase)
MDERWFPNAAASVSDARRFAELSLDGLPSESVHAVVMMVSELTTNAIRYGTNGFRLRIDCARSRGMVRVEVVDHGAGRPALQSPTAYDLHGRGLRIVELLSDDWGTLDAEDYSGKCVWFELMVPVEVR